MTTDTQMMPDSVGSILEQISELKGKLRDEIRAQPPEPVEDWELKNPDGSSVRLSELFGDHHDLLVVHNMGAHCNYCSLWADGFIGLSGHLNERCAFVLCSDDDAPALETFKTKRGWTFRCVSGHASGFAGAMGFRAPDGKAWPGVSAFHKNNDGSIVRTGSMPFGPGDDFCAVWPMMDLLDGGPKGWEPTHGGRDACGSSCGCSG